MAKFLGFTVALGVALVVGLAMLASSAIVTCEPVAEAIGEDSADPGASGSYQTGAFETTSYGPPWNRMNGTGVTATGVDLRPAIPKYGVAVDPAVIPLGSRVYIQPNPHNHSGTFVAFDTGGAIRGRRIDFYDWRGRSAQAQWGRRPAQVSRSPFGTPGGPLITSSDHEAQTPAADPAPSGQHLAWPTQTKTVSSPFGTRWGRLHAGIDVPVPTGTALHAAAAGTIILRGWTGGYGNYLCIRHRSDLTTCYAHMSVYGSYQLGAQVQAGAVIGRSGNTGNSTGPHLHFEVRRGPSASSTPIDPMQMLGGASAPPAVDDEGVSEQPGCGGPASAPIETHVVGDSLAVGMKDPLKEDLDGWDLTVDAKTGRRLAEGRALLPPAGAGNRVIALSLGTNDGPDDTAELHRTNAAALDAAGQGGCVIWATIARTGYQAMNAAIRARADADPRIKIVDWQAHLRSNPDHLAADGIHSTPAGYRARAALYAEAIRECAPAPTVDVNNGLQEAPVAETAGPRAELRDGKALAPASAPAAVKRMIAAGNAIQHLPYTYGGGHDAGFTPSPGFDCSSTVSWVLHRAGLLDSPLVSGGLGKWGRPGKGRWVSIYSHAGHTFIVIAGQRLDTSPAGSTVNGARGPRWRGSAARPTGGFTVTHPPGL